MGYNIFNIPLENTKCVKYINVLVHIYADFSQLNREGRQVLFTVSSMC